MKNIPIALIALLGLAGCTSLGGAKPTPVVLPKPLLPVTAEQRTPCDTPEFESGASKFQMLKDLTVDLERCEQRRAGAIDTIDAENKRRADYNKSLKAKKK